MGSSRIFQKRLAAFAQAHKRDQQGLNDVVAKGKEEKGKEDDNIALRFLMNQWKAERERQSRAEVERYKNTIDNLQERVKVLNDHNLWPKDEKENKKSLIDKINYLTKIIDTLEEKDFKKINECDQQISFFENQAKNNLYRENQSLLIAWKEEEGSNSIYHSKISKTFEKFKSEMKDAKMEKLVSLKKEIVKTISDFGKEKIIDKNITKIDDQLMLLINSRSYFSGLKIKKEDKKSLEKIFNDEKISPDNLQKSLSEVRKILKAEKNNPADEVKNNKITKIEALLTIKASLNDAKTTKDLRVSVALSMATKEAHKLDIIPHIGARNIIKTLFNKPAQSATQKVVEDIRLELMKVAKIERNDTRIIFKKNLR